MSDIYDDTIVDMAAIEWYEQLCNAPVPKIERETIISTNSYEKDWRMETQSRSKQALMEKLGFEPFAINVLGTPNIKWYKFPDNFLSIREPRKGRLDFAIESEKGVKARKEKNKS